MSGGGDIPIGCGPIDARDRFGFAAMPAKSLTEQLAQLQADMLALKARVAALEAQRPAA